jgi:hypothetical protein
MSFNLFSAKRIRDRGIIWHEKYTKKTMGFKKKFAKLIGPGSYFRWEGYDPTTSKDYYVVVSPGYSKTKGKMFFAGIRRMPGEYSPNGEYFRSLRRAMAYAKEMWAVKMPKDFVDYTQEDLVAVRIPSPSGKYVEEENL